MDRINWYTCMFVPYIHSEIRICMNILKSNIHVYFYPAEEYYWIYEEKKVVPQQDKSIQMRKHIVMLVKQL